MAEGTSKRDRGGARANTRASALIAWSLAGLTLAMFVATIPLWFLARGADLPSSWRADLGVGGLVGGALFLAFPLVGALIASKRPKNAVGWLCLAVGLLFLLSGVFDYYGYYGAATPDSVPFPVAMAGISDWIWVPAVGLLGTYVLLLFPDGRLPSRRWRPLAWLSGAVILLLSLGVMLAPGPLGNLGGVRNPFGIEGAHWLTAGAYALLPLLPLCMLASALSLVLRYRRSGGEERQQIKWIAFAASVVVVVYAIAMIASLVFPEESWTTAGSVWWLNLLTYAVLSSFTIVPIAVGIAVLKYRLYEIDIIINRALVYGLSHGDVGRPLLRRHRCVAESVRFTHRPAVHPRSRSLHPPYSGAVYSLEAAHTVLHRQALLPQQVRCQKDPGSLLGQAQR